MSEQVQRVNRIYATKDDRLGTIYKIKKDFHYKVNTNKKNWKKGLTDEQIKQVEENGYYTKDKYDKLGNAPEHCIIDNENKLKLEEIDLDYYINLAKERIAKYLGGNELTMATTEKNETIKEETNNTVRLWKKITKLTEYFDKEASNFVKDGYNSNQKYEYVKADQYKAALRKGCLQCGLAVKVNLIDFTKLELENKSTTMTAVLFRGIVLLIDVDTGESTAYNCLAVGADNLDKQASKAETLLIKDFIKSNFLIGDNEDSDDPEADPQPIKVVKSTSDNSANIPLPKETKEAIKDKIVAENQVKSNIPEETITYVKDLIDKIREASGNPSEGTKTLDTITNKDGAGNYTIDPLDLKRKIKLLEDRANALGIQI